MAELSGGSGLWVTLEVWSAEGGTVEDPDRDPLAKPGVTGSHVSVPSAAWVGVRLGLRPLLAPSQLPGPPAGPCTSLAYSVSGHTAHSRHGSRCEHCACGPQRVRLAQSCWTWEDCTI